MNIAAIILRRPTGEYFVHQRRADKRSFPNLYGLGAGGKVEFGELPAHAAGRELKEETGIDADPVLLFSFDFEDYHQTYHLHVFELVTEETVRWNNREWQHAAWVSESEVERLAQAKLLCPDTALFFAQYKAAAVVSNG